MKEGFFDSVRVRLFIAGVVFQLLVLVVPAMGLEFDQANLQDAANVIAGLIAVLIYGRTVRNVRNSS